MMYDNNKSCAPQWWRATVAL